MRVRYGKPIKVSNCYPYTKSTTIFPRSSTTSNSYLTLVHYDDAKVFSNVQDNLNHLYFFYAEINGNTSSLRNDILLGSNTLAQQSRYVDGNKFCAVAKLTSVGLTSVFFYINSNQQIGDFTVLFHCGIDITKTFGSGKEPTAQEFYSKYNKYFPLIATGEEITIDDKAGQVSLKKLLPDEYQEVEYIEGDGGQYMPVINTLNNRAINGNLTVGYKFQATVHDRAMYFSTITCNLSSGQAYSLGYINANSYLYIRWNQMVNSNTQVVGYQVGDIVEVIRTNNVETILKTYSLFTHGDSSTLTWKGRIYKYWLKLDNEYLFNWIPCYRKSDNVIGLYDLVSGTFSTNIGTGTFLKGPNVTNTISCKVAGGSSDIYYGYNQSADISQTTSSLRGLDYTAEGLGTLSISGTSEQSENKVIGVFNAIQNHKYLALTNFITGTPSTSTYWIKWITVAMGKDIGNGLFFTSNTTSSSAYIMFVVEGANIQVNCKMQFQIIDLTDWFGAGKEPSTLTEFKEKFTKDYYGFCPTPIKLTRYQIEALPNYGYNQLIKNGNFVDTSCWSPTYGTITTNDNICTYTITQVGTVGSNQNRINYAQSWQTNIIAQHKFLFASEIYCKYTQNLSFIVHDRSNGYRGVMSSSKKGVANSWNELSAIMTAKYDCLASNADMRIGFSSTADSAVGDKYYAKNFILVDLTDWYGEGKEPTTVEEFKQTFPNKYYAYGKKRLLNKYMINKLEN